MQLPEAIEIYNKYKDDGVRVIGIATAFEDFDKNTLDNFEDVSRNRRNSWRNKKVYVHSSMSGQLQEGDKLPYKIPFPLAMDNMVKTTGGEISQEKNHSMSLSIHKFQNLIHNQKIIEKSNHTKSQRLYEIKRIFC